MNELPSYDLELKAADERRRLHSSLAELKSHVRDTLDVNKNASEHLGLACALAIAVGLGTGYSLTGMFTRH